MTVVSQSRARLERVEEPVDPAAVAPAVRVGRRPGAELLAVVAHHPDAVARLGRVVAQVADHVLDRPERDPVAQALLRPEDGEQVALVLGRVGAPQVLLGDRGRAEVLVVEDRPAVAGRGERRRQVGLPDALGEPGAASAAAERSPRSRRPCASAGRRGRARGATRGPARTGRRPGPRPGPSRRGRAAARGTPAARPRATRAAGRCSGARGGRRGGARAPRASAGRPARRPRRTPSRSSRPADGCGWPAPARSWAPSVASSQRVDAATGRDPGSGSAPAAAAGRYSRSTYSWSIRVVENRQIVLAIELRMSCSQRAGRPFGVALVVGRDQLVLEDPVQVLRVGPVLGALVVVRSRGRRWPSRCRRSSPRPTSRRAR